MQSILEHTDSKLCFHILHDETVSEENKRKLQQVAHQKGDSIQFHFIDSSIFDDVKERLHRFTVGTMFRLMLPEMLPNLNKIIYLDADLFVNIDIKDFWNIDITNYYFAGVPDYNTLQHTCNPYPVMNGEVKRENYINCGSVILNLENIRSLGNFKDNCIDYLMNNPSSGLLDQDAFNVICKEKVLILDEKWNLFVTFARSQNIQDLRECIYHFAGTSMILYSGCSVDLEYFKTVCKTPWNDSMENYLIRGCFERVNDRIKQYENMITRLCQPGVKHIVYGEENEMVKKLYDRIPFNDGDYRVLKQAYNQNADILPCKNLEDLKKENGPIIIFVRWESDNSTAIQNLEKLGFKNEKDFFVIARFFSVFDGGFA